MWCKKAFLFGEAVLQSPRMSKRLLSGIQPSGELHLGNYLGAIKQWISLQQVHESLFCIVDLHAITARQDPKKLHENIRRVAASYLACGVDPQESAIFVQSSVSAHAELAWVLSTFTQMGELERMTQFKDKSKGKGAGQINAGLFTYPVLMAADILLYKPTAVPVGDDQKQHIELTRNIAERFNNYYKTETFVVPEGVFPSSGARIMGLDDPTAKMSKSAPSDLNFISFSDDADVVRKKVKKAVTDSGSDVTAGDDKPALTNLLTIYSLLTGREVSDIEKDYVGKGYGDFKAELAEVIVEWLAPVQLEMKRYLDDPAQLDIILAAGTEQANRIAQVTLDEVYKTVGLGY